MHTPSARHFHSFSCTAIAAVLCATALTATAADHAPARQAPATSANKNSRAAAADAETTRLASAAPTLPAEPAGDDAMDQLRQRLGERLAAVKGSTTGGHEDLRVMARSAPSASADKPEKPGRAGAARAAAKAGDKVAAADAHGAHWDYSGGAGPQSWGGLKPEFSLCTSGQRQSPHRHPRWHVGRPRPGALRLPGQPFWRR